MVPLALLVVRRGRHRAPTSTPTTRERAHRRGRSVAARPVADRHARRPRRSRSASRPSAAARRSWSTATATAARCILVLELGRRDVTIGRRPDNDVALPGTARSRACTPSSSASAASGSSSTTGCRATARSSTASGSPARRRVSDGDRLVVGRDGLLYRAPSDATGTRPSTPSGRDRDPGATPTETQRQVLVGLCRPLKASAYATPATNREIAEELHLSVDAVKAHLRRPLRPLRHRRVAAEPEARAAGGAWRWSTASSTQRDF